MLAAEMGPPSEVSLSEMCASGVAKFLERWVRIGVRRSSSSRRGRARAVSWGLLAKGFFVLKWTKGIVGTYLQAFV